TQPLSDVAGLVTFTQPRFRPMIDSLAPLATTLITSADDVGPLRRLTNSGATQALASSLAASEGLTCSGEAGGASGVVKTSSTPLAPRSCWVFPSQAATPTRFGS